MPTKELLIQHLRELIDVVTQSDGDQDAMRRIRRERFYFPFWDEDVEYRLRKLD